MQLKGTAMPTTEALDLDRLLAPISDAAPCGEDLAFSSEIDAIQRARQADDPSIEQGAWVTELKEADWKFVAKQCAALIAKRSKDMQLAVWLTEASAKTGGLRALGDSLLLTAMLCERYWDGLYPLLDDGGVEQRIGNLSWVAARSAQWVREIPLSGASGASVASNASLLDDASHCLAAAERLERCVDERLGADGPGFTAVRAALGDVKHVLEPLARQEQGAGGASDEQVGNTGVQEGRDAGAAIGVFAGTGATLPAGGVPQTRAQALAQLRAVAEFFRHTEPHSPVAYLAEKAAAWGEQPLHVWLRGVIKDDASFAHVEELLGVAARPA
jgi:type VI secretion system protein ImpA